MLVINGIVKGGVHRLDVINDPSCFRTGLGQDADKFVVMDDHLHPVKFRMLVGAEIDLGGPNALSGLDGCIDHRVFAHAGTIERVVGDVGSRLNSSRRS